MGARQTKSKDGHMGHEEAPELGFDDFEVLRAIGRGAFGKVTWDVTLNFSQHDQKIRELTSRFPECFFPL